MIQEIEETLAWVVNQRFSATDTGEKNAFFLFIVMALTDMV